MGGGGSNTLGSIFFIVVMYSFIAWGIASYFEEESAIIINEELFADQSDEFDSESWYLTAPIIGPLGAYIYSLVGDDLNAIAQYISIVGSVALFTNNHIPPLVNLLVILPLNFLFLTSLYFMLRGI